MMSPAVIPELIFEKCPSFSEENGTWVTNRQLTWPAVLYTKVIWKFVHEALTFIIPDLSPIMAATGTGKAHRCYTPLGSTGQRSKLEIHSNDSDKQLSRTPYLKVILSHLNFQSH